MLNRIDSALHVYSAALFTRTHLRLTSFAVSVCGSALCTAVQRLERFQGSGDAAEPNLSTVEQITFRCLKYSDTTESSHLIVELQKN